LVLLCLAGREAEAGPPLAVAPFGSDQAKAHQKAWADHLGTPVQITDSVGIKFNLIPPGEFLMGSLESEPGRFGDETRHLVKITKPFYLSAYEVIQAQYQRVMGSSPSIHKDDTKPVEMVNWNDAVEFCGKLSDQEGVEYRLPTEAEWEYACRAGTTTAYSSGDTSFHLDTTGWFANNSGKTVIDSTRIWKDERDNYVARLFYNGCRPHVVGRKTPNAWDLYDMHGNVWEWCQDWYALYDSLQVVRDPTGPTLEDWPSSNPLVPRRVMRGGAFTIPPRFVRAAFRNANQPDLRSPNLGFRLARTYALSP
jgi:formylglycine-generating enzyme required for sulfatase activity